MMLDMGLQGTGCSFPPHALLKSVSDLSASEAIAEKVFVCVRSYR